MIIEATSQIDYETYRRFFISSFLQSRRHVWRAPLLIALSPMLAIAFLVMYLFDNTDVISLVGFGMMLFMTLVIIAIITVMPRRYYLALKDRLMTPTHYRFLADRVEVRTDRPGDPTVEVLYENISQAYENDSFFTINPGAGLICIIGRSDFNAGSADDLRSLLADRLGERFVCKRHGCSSPGVSG